MKATKNSIIDTYYYYSLLIEVKKLQKRSGTSVSCRRKTLYQKDQIIIGLPSSKMAYSTFTVFPIPIEQNSCLVGLGGPGALGDTRKDRRVDKSLYVAQLHRENETIQ